MTRASSSRASISRAVTFLVPGSNCSTFSACSVSGSVSRRPGRGHSASGARVELQPLGSPRLRPRAAAARLPPALPAACPAAPAFLRHLLLALCTPRSPPLIPGLTCALSMQVEVDRDSERGVQRAGNRKEFWNAIRNGGDGRLFQNLGRSSGACPPALRERPGLDCRRAGGLPPGFREETRGPGDSHALPRERLLLRAACGRGPGGRHRPLLPRLPALDLALLPLCSAAAWRGWAHGSPGGRGARPGLPSRGWRARPCIYTLGPRLWS